MRLMQLVNYYWDSQRLKPKFNSNHMCIWPDPLRLNTSLNFQSQSRSFVWIEAMELFLCMITISSTHYFSIFSPITTHRHSAPLNLWLLCHICSCIHKCEQFMSMQLFGSSESELITRRIRWNCPILALYTTHTALHFQNIMKEEIFAGVKSKLRIENII